MRVRKKRFKDGKDEVTAERIKDGAKLVIEWV